MWGGGSGIAVPQRTPALNRFFFMKSFFKIFIGNLHPAFWGKEWLTVSSNSCKVENKELRLKKNSGEGNGNDGRASHGD